MLYIVVAQIGRLLNIKLLRKHTRLPGDSGFIYVYVGTMTFLCNPFVPSPPTPSRVSQIVVQFKIVISVERKISVKSY